MQAETGNLHLLGMGHFHPENTIDNKFLEDLNIQTNDEWILERTGIRTRRTVLDLDYIRSTGNQNPREAAAASSLTNPQTGAKAAEMAMARAGITAAQVGLVLAGGCSPQYSIPAESAMTASVLGITAPCFDISSACSSFAAQVKYLFDARPETLPDYILVINAENTTRTVDYRDRSTAVLWGDGSAAAVFSPRIKGKFEVLKAVLDSDPQGWDKVFIPAGGHFSQNGPAVQNFAIRKSGQVLEALRPHLTSEDHWFIGHQANLLMLQSVCSRARISEEKHLYNVDRYGNCGAAGAPSVLSMNWDRFVPDDEVALVVVGSGLTWGGMALKAIQRKEE